MSQSPALIAIAYMNVKDYIPKPCHEDWNKMTGDQRQKFCDHCSCSVHNLTGMNHEEIVNLREKLGGKLCGAFHGEKKVSTVRRVQLKPIAIGMGIGLSSLALAACNSAEKATSDGGECVGVTPEVAQTEQTNQNDPVMETLGEVCPAKNPPMIKGDICLPEKSLILGKIRLPTQK